MNQCARTWAATVLGLTVDIVRKLTGQVGFQVLPRRWVAQRTRSWINRCRRTVRDYERLPPPGSWIAEREEEQDSRSGQVGVHFARAQPVDLQVGQDEGLRVRRAPELDAGLLAYGAVRAVAADHVPGGHRLDPAVAVAQPARWLRGGQVNALYAWCQRAIATTG